MDPSRQCSALGSQAQISCCTCHCLARRVGRHSWGGREAASLLGRRGWEGVAACPAGDADGRTDLGQPVCRTAVERTGGGGVAVHPGARCCCGEPGSESPAPGSASAGRSVIGIVTS